MSTANYRLFEGPGHAWLEVPVSEITADMNITRYSWTVGDQYYLEEDVDMVSFLRAKDMTVDELYGASLVIHENAPGYESRHITSK